MSRKLTRKWRIESTKHFYISPALHWLKIGAGRSGLTKYLPEKKGYFAQQINFSVAIVQQNSKLICYPQFEGKLFFDPECTGPLPLKGAGA